MDKSIFIHPIAILGCLNDLDENQFSDNKTRIVGGILGAQKKKIISCNSSFKVPFEEDKSIWFIDHSFIDKMLEMHKKINKREVLIGWYSFCKKIMDNDTSINEIFYSYSTKPLFILIWVDKFVNGLVLEAYSVKKSKSSEYELFQKKKVSIGMLESEDIGIQQILRDSQKWTTNFRANILVNWYYMFTSFSKFFRKIFENQIALSKYKKLGNNLFLTKNVIRSMKNSKSFKNSFNVELLLLYFLNILKLNLRLDNTFFRNIL